MNYAKVMSLAIAAAAVTMAIIGATSASATVMCKTETDPCTENYSSGTSVHEELEGAAKFSTTGGEVLDECTTSVLEGKVENAGSATSTPTIGLGITWGFCKVVTIEVLAGSIEIHKIPKTWNFTLTGKGAEITLAILGASCNYSFGNAVDLGTVTPLKFKFDVNAKLKKSAGGFTCPAEIVWAATYVGTPTPVYAAES